MIVHFYPVTTEICSKVVLHFWNNVRINIERIWARCKTPSIFWLRNIIFLQPHDKEYITTLLITLEML